MKQQTEETLYQIGFYNIHSKQWTPIDGLYDVNLYTHKESIKALQIHLDALARLPSNRPRNIIFIPKRFS